ncbi:VOC family protein [Chloracidobacterium validum]|uniref:Bleomycin resistance protein n=1 Tax=Chloracidobacterium validum TaxID=2821543 RepID=A0ABX8B8K3_9BACT|nr:VOC family protein [Chloracidobacterium validum]QUW03019.1 VOC family protein [Chloracidobacterium validum]
MTQTVIPQLRMLSAQRSLLFYTQGLGFQIDWQHQFEPGSPLFCQLTRDGQTIFLTEHADDCQVGGAVYFQVADVDACYRSFTANGITTCPPEAMPWGMREMVITDPDGNRLRFASRLGV